MNKLSRIIRYQATDGILNLPDSYLAMLYYRMKKERTLSTVFYNMPDEMLTVEWFIGFMKYRVALWIVEDTDDEPGAMVWLTNIVGKRAEIHFNVFKKYWGYLDPYCEQVFKTVEKNFDLIYGIIPVFNALAMNVANKYFKHIGELPMYSYRAKDGETFSAIIYARTSK